MANFFERLMGRGSRRSGSKAKERLQLVLIHDRLNLPPERLEEMKQEIMAVISKYVSVDAKNVDIALRQRDRDSLIVAEVPFSKTNERPLSDDEFTTPPPRTLHFDDDDEDTKINF